MNWINRKLEEKEQRRIQGSIQEGVDAIVKSARNLPYKQRIESIERIKTEMLEKEKLLYQEIKEINEALGNP